ncbi:hypothetical protein OG730_09940 [Streptomyces sp. NBC_01298]|uniref:hypothetical protein n=1 Tax=Streptomyces sp. NBC_01298 TaxID=2903817 RepID=UPI002E1571F5|nr:hypothetical protein OG730_09940 [Streptomyces sp. NBC_01298]
MSHIPGPQYPQQPYGPPQGQPPYQQQPVYQQQPQYGYQQPPQQVYVQNQPTRTVHGVGCLGSMFHACMTLMTFGLWYPIWRRAKRTSRHY